MKHSLILAIAGMKSRPVHTVLSMVAVAAGIALLSALLLLSQNIGDGIARNARGVDVIVGAKGSPLQLVLSSIYHADVPVGNIEMTQMNALLKNPQIKQAIPIAVGDSYKGWRVVGTSADYLNLYGAKPQTGRVFDKPFEVAAGAATGLDVGQKFAAVHGFAADGDDVHDFHLYEVVGTLAPTGTVLDKLLITPLESVQQLHAHHEEHEHEEGHADHHDEDESPEEQAAEEALAHQVTAVLLKVRSPMAAMMLPREINKNADLDLMAASPAYEMTRLSSSMGFGKNEMLIIGAGILTLSVLMLFSNLASGLASRKYDLSVMRVLGASPSALFTTVMAEGILIGGAGALAGVMAGHTIAYLAVLNMETLQSVVRLQDLLYFGPQDLVLILIGIGTGAVAALLPAITALKLNIADLLARGTA